LGSAYDAASQEPTLPAQAPDPAPLPPPIIYLIAFVTGAIVMSFEMLGSRYLNPYFGSGLYTWASRISTVLGALTVGYFIGGWLADRHPSVTVLGGTVLIGSLYMLVLPAFAQPMLEAVLAGIDDIKLGSLLASMAILFFPVTFFGMYSPFAIRLMLRSPAQSGRVSGAVYGISTIGSIAGTLGTTFFLLPSMGSRTLTLSLGAIGVAAALVLFALPWLTRRRAAVTGFAATALLLCFAADARAQALVDDAARAALLKRPDGQIARIETEFNDIFITKRRNEITMSFQLKGWDYTESVTDLRDPDALPVHYTRFMPLALAYPETPSKVLMIGLGGGSISTYLGRAMPDLTIDTVEIDAGVINAAKRYFGILETPRVKYISADGRVFLNRNKQLYDLILVDAFHGGYVPFHLLTREFYTLIKQRLAPGGAVAFNVHEGTKLYVSTIRTLNDVFPSVHLYPTGQGEVIVVATAQTAPADDVLKARAAALQQRHGFRYPLPQMLAKRIPQPALGNAELLTDDFAPVDLYDQIGREQNKRR
jgi:spermidine synthase